MLDLPGVTLACIDTANHALALRALERSRQQIRFARTMLLTDALPNGVVEPEGVDVVPIDTLRSRDDYSRFVLKRLIAHVQTPHVLLVQWDGYVVNPSAWEDAFLACDYLGARWFWFDDGHDVGNGGFSLRSRRLLQALQDPRIDLVEAEDVTIGRAFRSLLEREYGIRFASGELAERFAFEAAYPIGMPFGFHGLFNFCRVVPAPELAELAATFSDAIAGSIQIAQLLRNCVALGQWAPAIAIANRILAIDRDRADVRALLAQSEDALARGTGIGRNDPCPCGSGKRYKACHGALGMQAPPMSADALAAQGIELHRRGDVEGAARAYERALAIDARHPYALHYLGVIDYQRGNAAAALPRLSQAVALNPGEPEFHNNLGLALVALDRYDDAASAHRAALALKPDHAGAWNNLGLALAANNQLSGAIEAYRRALALAPGFDEPRWNLALALLADGQFREGWRAYESRHTVSVFADHTKRDTPRWDGNVAAGRTILLASEQGLGDAIQFVRLAPLLADRGAGVIVEARKPLANLFRSVAGVQGVTVAGDTPPPHDAWLPLLSLASVLDVGATTIPADVPYLKAEASLRADAAHALAPFAGKLRVGLAWAGNPRNVGDKRRSLPLATLAPLLHLPGVRWFSLQKGDGEDQLATVPEAGELVLLPQRNDFDGTAALISELDLVVSVDTSIAHLAGALARPVFVMLPSASDWRWRVARRDSDWYPTARLFRQSKPGDWSNVIEEVRVELEALDISRSR